MPLIQVLLLREAQLAIRYVCGFDFVQFIFPSHFFLPRAKSDITATGSETAQSGLKTKHIHSKIQAAIGGLFMR